MFIIHFPLAQPSVNCCSRRSAEGIARCTNHIVGMKKLCRQKSRGDLQEVLRAVRSALRTVRPGKKIEISLAGE